MAQFYDITDWNEKPFYNTKGTRNKCVVNNPENNIDYYFKTSMIKEGKNYKSEFWSEVVASEVGRFLGLNVLEYNIAKHGNDVGCISESMNTEEECLTEGISLLTGYDNTYNPEDKSSYSAYTFQFIKSAIDSYDFDESIRDIIKTIIFDSIVGNSDRHQENWGFITPYKPLTEVESKDLMDKLKTQIKKIKIPWKRSTEEIVAEGVDKTDVILKMEGKYAPIYDSGCCLGREKSDEAVAQMLSDDVMFESFIDRGKSEIRWGDDGKKLNHFDLIKKIREEYKDIVDDEINKILGLCDLNKIRDIVFNIDKELPVELTAKFGLSLDRKKLMCKLIEKRLVRLKEVVL